MLTNTKVIDPLIFLTQGNSATTVSSIPATIGPSVGNDMSFYLYGLPL